MSSDTCPLKAGLLGQPVYSAALASDVASWVERIRQKVPHREGVLPHKVTNYDSPCLPGACVNDPSFTMAQDLLRRFRANFRNAHPTDAFVAFAEGEGGEAREMATESGRSWKLRAQCSATRAIQN
eukprot:15437889-Alexandrium_andersonii.AAC.1